MDIRDNEPHWRRLRTLSLLILAGIALGVALEATSSVIVPIIIAAFIAFVVTPMVDHFQVRMKVPRALAVLGAFATVIGGFLALGALMTASIRGFAERGDFYQEKITSMLNTVSEQLAAMGVDLGTLSPGDSGPLLGIAQDAAAAGVGLIGNMVLVLILTLYLIASRSPDRRLIGLWGAIEHTMRVYMGTKLATSALTGICSGLILWMFGVDLALAFGVLTFLLNFVPTVGSITATVLPLPVALVTLDGGVVLALLVCLSLVHNLVGNLLEPKMMGIGLDLHPVTILVSLGLWGMIFGLVGMLLSAPLTAVVKIILDRDPTTRPMAEFLAGRLHAAEPIAATPSAAAPSVTMPSAEAPASEAPASEAPAAVAEAAEQ